MKYPFVTADRLEDIPESLILLKEISLTLHDILEVLKK